MRRTLLALAGLIIVLAVVPNAASAKVKWLCAPGMKNNPCWTSMKTTVFSSWGQVAGTTNPRIPAARKVDCFYVYPTVSNQNGPNATLAATPEIRSQALIHAARFTQTCRVFAPLYRQVTVPALSTGAFGGRPLARAYSDVLAAWKQYLKKYNHGRGFVLIGHSQGSFHLTRLIQQQIDGNARLRSHLVSAILPGGNVTDGSFHNIPPCRDPQQLHCVVAYSSFNQTPPANSLFARSPTPGQQVLCTNPAALSGGPAVLDSIISTEPFAQGYIAAGILLLRFPLPKVGTPWLEATNAFSAECSTDGGASFLKLTSLDGTPVPKPAPTPGWGLHLLDVNVALGDLIRLVQSQAQAYAG